MHLPPRMNMTMLLNCWRRECEASAGSAGLAAVDVWTLRGTVPAWLLHAAYLVLHGLHWRETVEELLLELLALGLLVVEDASPRRHRRTRLAGLRALANGSGPLRGLSPHDFGGCCGSLAMCGIMRGREKGR